ncbi:LolA family protein [Luteolibacter sp. AS25]|uniref:LolA family protein n=1 Tax=Luteolibacter sp. AS25 TaxID=3135776 RepID=UPI00398AD611
MKLPSCLVALLLGCTNLFAQDLSPLRNALEKQQSYKTVSVDVRQTKKSPALAEETKLKGHLWLKPGEAFRWELGSPPEQIAVYDGSTLVFLDEKKKTAKKVDSDDRKAKPLFLMLGFGDGASFSEIEENFSVNGTNTVDEHFIVSLSPKGSLRRGIKSLVMQVNTKTSFIERIEFVQKDGTKVVTEFYPPKINGGIPASNFDVKAEGYTWE